jgi:hypothetical protein
MEVCGACGNLPFATGQTWPSQLTSRCGLSGGFFGSKSDALRTRGRIFCQVFFNLGSTGSGNSERLYSPKSDGRRHTRTKGSTEQRHGHASIGFTSSGPGCVIGLGGSGSGTHGGAAVVRWCHWVDRGCGCGWCGAYGEFRQPDVLRFVAGRGSAIAVMLTFMPSSMLQAQRNAITSLGSAAAVFCPWLQ